MKIEYSIINPAGNVTALVSGGVQACERNAAAAAIMKKHPKVEQVGFVRFEKGKAVLCMAGGEFCGNAVMSAAALYCKAHAVNMADIAVNFMPFNITVPAGASENGGVYGCRCRIALPPPAKNVTFTANGREYTFPAAELCGITHIVADDTLDEDAAEKAIKPLAKRLGVKALGIMLYGENGSMRPLVYVPGADTLFFENSCASGSCAAAFIKGKAGDTLKIIQPGGDITARKTDNGICLGVNCTIEKYCSEEV